MNLRIIQGSIREYWRRSKGFEKSGLKQKYGGKPDENSVGIGKTSLPKGFKGVEGILEDRQPLPGRGHGIIS